MGLEGLLSLIASAATMILSLAAGVSITVRLQKDLIL